ITHAWNLLRWHHDAFEDTARTCWRLAQIAEVRQTQGTNQEHGSQNARGPRQEVGTTRSTKEAGRSRTTATEGSTSISALAMLHQDQSDHDQRRQDLHRQKNGQHYVHLQLQKLCATNGSAGDKGISVRPLQYSKNRVP